MASLKELMDLSGKVALVTGGHGHVGRVVAETLLELGATVVLTDHDDERLEERAQQLRERGAVFTLRADLTSVRDCRRLIDTIRDGPDPRLDILLHTAALTGQGAGIREGWVAPFQQQSVEAFDRSYQVQARSLFIMAQQAWPMLKEHRGNIVVFGSSYGRVAPNSALYEGTDMEAPLGYSASKGAVRQMIRHLAATMAPEVRVNMITPGGLWREQPEVFVKRYEERTPLKRMGTEEDLKGAIAYLCTDLSRYVTGHDLVVDGGWTIW